jgi:hypothetical protein
MTQGKRKMHNALLAEAGRSTHSETRADEPCSSARPARRSVGKVCAIIAAILVSAPASLASEGSPFSGVYRAGRPCRGDEAKSGGVLITITPQQITHPGGVCVIEDAKAKGNTAVLRTTCTDSHGKVLTGEVSFTKRAEDIIDVVALDGTYRAVLNRCASARTATQASDPAQAGAADTPAAATAPRF